MSTPPTFLLLQPGDEDEMKTETDGAVFHSGLSQNRPLLRGPGLPAEDVPSSAFFLPRICTFLPAVGLDSSLEIPFIPADHVNETCFRSLGLLQVRHLNRLTRTSLRLL